MHYHSSSIIMLLPNDLLRHSSLQAPLARLTLDYLRAIQRRESEVVVTQLCLILCDPMAYSPWGFSVHGILQARLLEWVAIPFSRGSSQSRDQTCFAGRFFTIWATREPPEERRQWENISAFCFPCPNSSLVNAHSIGC